MFTFKQIINLLLLSTLPRIFSMQFLQNNSVLSVRDETQFTPLHLAVMQGSLQEVEALIQIHAVDVKARTGETPLFFAVLQGNKKAVATLLRAGADPLQKNNHGVTVVDLANDLANKTQDKNYFDILALLHPPESYTSVIKSLGFSGACATGLLAIVSRCKRNRKNQQQLHAIAARIQHELLERYQLELTFYLMKDHVKFNVDVTKKFFCSVSTQRIEIPARYLVSQLQRVGIDFNANKFLSEFKYHVDYLMRLQDLKQYGTKNDLVERIPPLPQIQNKPAEIIPQNIIIKKPPRVPVNVQKFNQINQRLKEKQLLRQKQKTLKTQDSRSPSFLCNDYCDLANQ